MRQRLNVPQRYRTASDVDDLITSEGAQERDLEAEIMPMKCPLER